MSDPNVYQRMSKACEIIGQQPWAKDLKNSQFSSIPIDDMRRGVRDACVKAGLVHVGPYGIDKERTSKGDRMTLIEGSCRFKYINVDKPDDIVEYESLGEAMDTGDKATGKFLTNLIKNHYKAAFDIGEQGKDDIDAYSNEEMYAEEESIKRRVNVETKKSAPTVDRFFSTPIRTPTATDKAPPAEKKDVPSEAEIANIINVKGQTARYKDVVRDFKIAHGAKSAYDLPYLDKIELWKMITEGSE